MATTTQPNHLRIVLAAVAALGFWGSAFVATRVALVSFTPGEVALYRYSVASLTLALVAWWLRPPLPRRQDLPRLIAVGVIGVGLYTLALNTGLQTVTAGAASFIVNTAPLFSVVFACVILKERPGWPGWLGLLIGLAGLGLIATGEKTSGISPRALLIFGSAIAWALYQIIQKPLLPYYGPVGVVCYAIWFGTAIFLPFLPGLLNAMPMAPLQHHATAIYLGVLPGAMAFLAWSYLLSQLSVTRATPLLYLVPVVSLITAWLVIDERPVWQSVIGGTIAVVGVAVSRWSHPSRSSPPISTSQKAAP
jgi:drug/metabolite transporter (DMT)-like permease